MYFVCAQEIPIRSTAVVLDHHACLPLSRQLLSGWTLETGLESGQPTSGPNSSDLPLSAFRIVYPTCR